MSRLLIDATITTQDFSARFPQDGVIIFRMSATDADGVAYRGLAVEHFKILAIVEEPSGAQAISDTLLIEFVTEWEGTVQGVYDVTVSHPHSEPPTVGGWFRRRHTLIIEVEKGTDHGRAVFSVDLTNIDSQP
jgi:hypothetical protein